MSGSFLKEKSERILFSFLRSNISRIPHLSTVSTVDAFRFFFEQAVLYSDAAKSPPFMDTSLQSPRGLRAEADVSAAGLEVLPKYHELWNQSKNKLNASRPFPWASPSQGEEGNVKTFRWELGFFLTRNKLKIEKSFPTSSGERLLYR